MPEGVLRPDARLQAKYYLVAAVVYILFFFPWIFMGFIPELGWGYVVVFLLLSAIVLAIIAVLIPLYYRSISYALTDEEIVTRRGIITKTVQRVPYRTVTNVEVKRGPFDRLLGIGGIHVQTAGFSQQARAEAHLEGLANYDEVDAEIEAALRRYRARTGPSIGVEEPAPVGGEGELLREILAELRAIRAQREG
jgi:membrane protein YdbS with pleckstrin-like domain